MAVGRNVPTAIQTYGLFQKFKSQTWYGDCVDHWHSSKKIVTIETCLEELVLISQRVYINQKDYNIMLVR